MPYRKRLAGALAVSMVLILGACSSDSDDDASDAPETTAGDGATSSPEDSTTTPDTAPTSGGGQVNSFSMLVYNVAGLPQEVSTEQPSTDIPLISPLLEEYDLVMTQEDFDWWQPAIDTLDFVNYHTRLRAENDFPYETEQHPGPEAVGIDVANDRPTMLVGDGLGMMSRFPLADIDRVPWPNCYGGADTGAGDCLAMKGFARATMELADGVEVDVYTLHAEAGEGPEDQPLQVEDFEVLAAYINENSAGRAVIIGGDTNLHLEDGHDQQAGDTPIWEGFLEATGLTDVCTEVDCANPGSIDKVAYRNSDTLTLVPQFFEWRKDVFVDDAGEDLSDHPPVAVDWSWTAS